MSEDDFNTFADGEEDSLMINLAEVEAMSFEAIPKGSYPVVVEECDFQISKSSGKPMWNVKFSITEGEYANRKLWTYMSFSEKALPMTKTNIAVLAPELLDGAFNPKTVADEGTLVGRTALAKVAIEKGQDGNEDRNVIKSLKAAGSGNDDGFMG